MDHNAEKEHQVYGGYILDEGEMVAENNNSKGLEEIAEEEAEMKMGSVQGSKHIKKNHKQILEPKEVAVLEDEVAPPRPQKTRPQSDWPPWAVDFVAQFIDHMDRPIDDFKSYLDNKFADMLIWMDERLIQAVLEPEAVIVPDDVNDDEQEVAPPTPKLQKTGLRSEWPQWARDLDAQLIVLMNCKFAKLKSVTDDKYAETRIRMVKCLREAVLEPKAVVVVPEDDEDTDDEDYMSEDEGAAPQKPQQIGPKSKRPQWENDVGALVTGHMNRRFVHLRSFINDRFADMHAWMDKCVTPVVIQKLRRSPASEDDY